MAMFRTLATFGVGYVLGSRAGRERYEQIKKISKKVWNSKPAQKGRDKVRSQASQTLHNAQDAAKSKFHEAKDSVKGAVRDRGTAVPDVDEIRVEAVPVEARPDLR
ncbi:hypothetical protein [Trueperella sp. LYQ143]|uniref:hypothetical protein n=1 Tax=unclassified Trueperella TaxID=2630174 RepID=UPI0039832578